MRKKIIFGGLTFVVLLLLSLPFLMGLVVHNQIYNMVNNVPSSPNLQVTVMSYKRGWLSSVADMRVRINLPKRHHGAKKGQSPSGDVRSFSFTIRDTIHHGPVIFSSLGVKFARAYVTSELVLDDKANVKFSEFFANQKEKPQLFATSSFNLFGGMVSKIDIPAFTFRDTNGTFQWLGLNGKWIVARGLKRIDGKMKFEGIQVVSPAMKIRFDGMDVSYHQKESSSGLWTGNGTFNFPSLVVNANGKPAFELAGISVVSISDVSNDLLSQNTHFKLNKLFVAGKTYGPCELISKLKNIDANVLHEIQQKVRTANSVTLTPQERHAILMSILPSLPNLVDKGAEYHLEKFSLQMPDGVVNATGMAEVERPNPAAQQMGVFSLIQRMKAHLEVQAPVVLTKQLVSQMMLKRMKRQRRVKEMLVHQLKKQRTQDPNAVHNQSNQQQSFLSAEEMQTKADEASTKQLQEWVANGMLQQIGDSYKIIIAFNNGRLLINGKPLPAKGRR